MPFPLGQVVSTPGARAALEPMVFFPLILERHRNGDWGDISDVDKQANDEAVNNGLRILSAYNVNGVNVWIITEADRSVTTILLPEEY